MVSHRRLVDPRRHRSGCSTPAPSCSPSVRRSRHPRGARAVVDGCSAGARRTDEDRRRRRGSALLIELSLITRSGRAGRPIVRQEGVDDMFAARVGGNLATTTGRRHWDAPSNRGVTNHRRKVDQNAAERHIKVATRPRGRARHRDAPFGASTASAHTLTVTCTQTGSGVWSIDRAQTQ